MNASTGFAPHALPFGSRLTDGTEGRTTGRKDQNSRALVVAAPVRGSGAPIFTHASRSATAAAGSFCSGMRSDSSACRTALISRLFSGSPGITAGPDEPPLSTPSRVSSRNSPLSFFASAEWHE